MTRMMEPRVKTGRKVCTRCLICYYTGDAYDQAIETAEIKVGVKDDAAVEVIGLPGERLDRATFQCKR